MGTKIEDDFVLIRSLLKKSMKANRLTYAHLATALKLSESGVKKIFRGKDLSLKKILRICEVLNISLADLLSEQGGSEFEDITFSEDQQKYFLTNMPCFYFYWKLVYERLPLDKVEASLALNSKESFKFLRALDKLGLLQLGPEKKIKLPRLRRIRSIGRGPLVDRLYKDWGKNLVQSVAKTDPLPNEQFLIRYLKMLPETFSDMQRDLKTLETEYVTRAIREMQLYPEQVIIMRWLTASDTKSFIAD